MTSPVRVQSLLVICPETGGGALFDRAASLARCNDATIELVQVLPRYDREPAPLRALARRALRERLEGAVARLGRDGVRVRTRVLNGKAFVEIIRDVLRHEHDLVLTAPVASGPLREALFGSTTSHLLRKCPVPVWVVRERRARRLRRVLAAVDLEAAETGSDLDRDLLQWAAAVSRAEASELHVVHCWSLPYEGLLWRAGYGREIPTMRALRGETREDRAEKLRALVDSVDTAGLDVHADLVRGEAEDRIPAVARARRIDLVVMGTIARTGLAGVFIGNTAERVLQRLPCSVLAIKPSGFRTPVE